jgi:hypothetical protein
MQYQKNPTIKPAGLVQTDLRNCGLDIKSGEGLPVFFDQTAASKFLGISKRTLERWRLEGTGPVFRKFGRRVFYARTDLLAWADARRRDSTSEDWLQSQKAPA